jgi:hypothetical protein
VEIYRLSKETLIAGLLGLCAVTVVLAVAMIAVAQSPAPGGLSVRPDLFMGFVLLGFLWYEFLLMPYLILVHPDKTAEFRSLAKRTRLRLAEIESAELLRLCGMVSVRHRAGSLHLFNEGYTTWLVLSALRDLNPRIRLKGFSV